MCLPTYHKVNITIIVVLWLELHLSISIPCSFILVSDASPIQHQSFYDWISGCWIMTNTQRGIILLECSRYGNSKNVQWGCARSVIKIQTTVLITNYDLAQTSAARCCRYNRIGLIASMRGGCGSKTRTVPYRWPSTILGHSSISHVLSRTNCGLLKLCCNFIL